MNRKNLIKTLLIISIIILFLPLFSRLPYGYYNLLRFIVCATSGLIAVAAYRYKKQNWMIAMGIIAILFNPIIPVHLAKANWTLIDLAVAVLFILFLGKFWKRKKNP